MVDLLDSHRAIIREIVCARLPQCIAYLYGSRARGTARRNSDVDICLRGPRALTREELEGVRDAMSASDLPFLYDVCDWHALDDPFRERIEPTFVAL